MIWRIRGRRPFLRLERDGVRIRSATLWCTYLPEPDQMPPRVAFSVGRAVGPAVVRNQVRRRLRHLVANLDLPSGWYLFGTRSNVNELTFEELAHQMQQLRQMIGTSP